MNKTIYITGMHCQHCVKAVEEALQGLEGIRQVNVDLEQNLATITADNVTDQMIKEAIEDIGFDVTDIR